MKMYIQRSQRLWAVFSSLSLSEDWKQGSIVPRHPFMVLDFDKRTYYTSETAKDPIDLNDDKEYKRILQSI